jgi:hypothetical protein
VILCCKLRSLEITKALVLLRNKSDDGESRTVKIMSREFLPERKKERKKERNESGKGKKRKENQTNFTCDGVEGAGWV